MVLQYVGVHFQQMVHTVQQQPEGMLATAEWYANVQTEVVQLINTLMSPQANLERVLAACQAMGAKMILPMMASRVHRMVVLEDLPPARLYAAMRQLDVYHAKAAEVQVPSMLQVANSWWVNGHGPCTAGYSTRLLRDMVSEAEAFFLPDLVCSLICVVLDTKAFQGC